MGISINESEIIQSVSTRKSLDDHQFSEQLGVKATFEYRPFPIASCKKWTVVKKTPLYPRSRSSVSNLSVSTGHALLSTSKSTVGPHTSLEDSFAMSPFDKPATISVSDESTLKEKWLAEQQNNAVIQGNENFQSDYRSAISSSSVKIQQHQIPPRTGSRHHRQSFHENNFVSSHLAHAENADISLSNKTSANSRMKYRNQSFLSNGVNREKSVNISREKKFALHNDDSNQKFSWSPHQTAWSEKSSSRMNSSFRTGSHQEPHAASRNSFAFHERRWATKT